MLAQERRNTRPFGYGFAAIALSVGLVLAPMHGVAYAEPADAGSASAQQAADGPEDGAESRKPPSRRSGPADTETPTTGSGESAPSRADEDADPVDSAPEDSGLPDGDTAEIDETAGTGELPGPGPASEPVAAREGVAPVPTTPTDAREPAAVALATVEPATPLPVLDRSPARAEVVSVTSPTAADVAPIEITRPAPPQPLSPVAQLLELPGRLINAVLQALGFTASANHPPVPNGLGPINDLIFGAFRELERLIGLHRTPPPLPEVPTLTYTGPTTRPTPTVAQFLNASAAGYVLGGTPGGLVPFTVNGFQLSRTNIFTGMVGRTWVTPEGQVIIAYQGTTGGSHLLFNPLITITQVLADLQVVFTRTTPLAFYDALDFAEQVLAEAAVQGYATDDIFVTGHSLGGWEAQFVAQQIGLAGIGFEAPGMNTRTPGNGADSMFVNIGTYGSSAPYMSTDLPGLQPFMPPYVPGGGTKPHYGPIVMIGDPAAMTPLYNASALWGRGLIGTTIFLVDYLINFFQYHLPGVQAYHLDVVPDPGMVLFLGTSRGPVHTGYGTLTIPQLMRAASDDGILFRP